MAKKPTSAAKKSSNGKVTSKRYSTPVRTMNKPTVKTPTSNMQTSAVRNTSIPKTNSVKTPTARRDLTHELIAERAYYISISGTGGSQDENWARAERELRDGR